MRRLAFLLILLLLIPSISQARPRGIYRTVASGTVTQINMRLSGVDGGSTASGGAFVDFGAANVLTTKVGHLLKITDSAGKSIMGYIKAAGTGETLSDELITEWASHGSHPVESLTLSGTDITQFINSAGDYGILYVSKLVDMRLGLYKYSTDVTINSGKFDNFGFGFGSAASAQRVVWTKPSVTGTYSGYITPNYTSSLAFISITAGATSALNAAFVNNTLKQVLTPSATGVTIVSTKGGATYNWFNKNSSFNWNDASGYTYQIIKENRAVTVATSSVSAGNALIDATTANAFAAPVGVDLTAYQDGRHLAHFTDSSGQVAVAWISSTAPSGLAVNDLIGGTNPNLKNGDFESGDTVWIKYSGATIGSGVASFSSVSNIGISQNVLSAALGQLYKYSYDMTKTGGTGSFIDIGGYTDSPTQTSNGTYTGYLTLKGSSANNTVYVFCSNAFSGTIDNITIQQLTMPAATGALLLSSKGGSRGWLYKSATFNPNLAQTLKILNYGD